MRLVALVVLCVAIEVPEASGQHILDSPYSVYGIGMMHDRLSSMNRSMGGTGIGIQNDLNLNNLNPASYGSVAFPVTHIYEAGTYFEFNKYGTSKSSASTMNGGLSHLQYGFKFKNWWSANFGVSRFSSVAYHISTTKDLSLVPDAVYEYEGSGNISQLTFGNGFTVIKNLSVGINVNYLFGSIRRNEIVITNGTEDELMKLENRVFSNALNVDYGVQYKVNFLTRALIFGLVYNNGVSLPGKATVTLQNQDYDTLTSYDGRRVWYKLPASAGAGVSLKSNRSVIAADARFTEWSKASFPSQDVAFIDTWRFSAGYAYLGNPKAERYLGLVGFRVGAYRQDYHLLLNGRATQVMGCSFGLSFPIADGKSALNITYTYDQMGTFQNNLIRQQSHKISFEVVIRDLWGLKRKFG